MKRIFISLACVLVFAATSLGNIPNEKVLKIFQTSFTLAENVKWYDHKEYYEVSFTQANISASVRYDMNGNLLSSKRYYKEQELPADIRKILNKKYSDKTIFGITEITDHGNITYYVKMEDDKNWITVKVNGNGQALIYEKRKKA